MSSKKTCPLVALVGRTNVGKSTLFNRLSRRVKSIVADFDGITRDYVHEVITWDNVTFDLVDTGGLVTARHTVIDKPSDREHKNNRSHLAGASIADPFSEHITQIGKQVCQDADLIVMMCDGKYGPTHEDHDIAQYITTLNKPILLLVNKADNKQLHADNFYEFYALGVQDVLGISALHGTGINDFLERVTAQLPTHGKAPEAPSFKITLLGKPNVGKSSLMNLLTQRERALVSDIAGTTREALSERISFYGEDLLMTDTAGLRRKRSVTDPIESLMVKSSLQAVRNSNMVILMVDSSENRLSDQELKLMFHAFEDLGKAVLLIHNKTDLVTDEKKDIRDYELKEYEFFLKKIPQIKLSCKTGKNVGIVMREIEKIKKRQIQEFKSTEINEMIQEAIHKKPMYHKRQLLKIFKIRQLKGKTLTFGLHVNYPEFFGPHNIAFIENMLRKKYDLLGCPLSFELFKIRG